MGSAARVTSAAEGLPRRRFTVAEVEAMVAAGVMEEDERVELIGGELVPMSPKGNHHETVKIALVDHWNRARPKNCTVAQETTFRLSEDTYLEPDVVIYPRGTGLAGLTATTVLLVVEIANSSLGYDTGPEGGALRQLWHSRALGHRCGSTDDEGLQNALARRLPRRSRLLGVRPAGSDLCAGGVRAKARRTGPVVSGFAIRRKGEGIMGSRSPGHLGRRRPAAAPLHGRRG